MYPVIIFFPLQGNNWKLLTMNLRGKYLRGSGFNTASLYLTSLEPASAGFYDGLHLFLAFFKQRLLK